LVAQSQYAENIYHIKGSKLRRCFKIAQRLVPGFVVRQRKTGGKPSDEPSLPLGHLTV